MYRTAPNPGAMDFLLSECVCAGVSASSRGELRGASPDHAAPQPFRECSNL